MKPRFVAVVTIAISIAASAWPTLASRYENFNETWTDCFRTEKAGHIERTVRACTDLIDQDTLHRWSAEALFARSEAYALAARRDEAIADLDRAIALRPDFAEAIEFRGQLRISLGQYDLAIGDLNAALRIKPDSVGALGARARVFAKLGRNIIALEDANNAIRLKPSEPTTYMMRGWVYEALGDFDNALKDFDTAVRMNADNVSFRCGFLARRGKTSLRLSQIATRHCVSSQMTRVSWICDACFTIGPESMRPRSRIVMPRSLSTTAWRVRSTRVAKRKFTLATLRVAARI